MTGTLLLDSGVWVASMNSDHPFELASRELVAGRHRQLGALDLTFYEIANVIALKRRRPREAVNLCRSVAQWCGNAIVRIDGDLIDSAVEVVAEYRLTAYDAAYVAVARRHDWTLVSTDIKDLVSKGLAITPDAAV
jgi:predicted nucleic acid-binding protein